MKIGIITIPPTVNYGGDSSSLCTSKAWCSLCCYSILGLVVKPYLVIKIVGYTWKDIWKVFKACLLVTCCSFPIPVLADCYFL